jgi:hypothetical protein
MAGVAWVQWGQKLVNQKQVNQKRVGRHGGVTMSLPPGFASPGQCDRPTPGTIGLQNSTPSMAQTTFREILKKIFQKSRGFSGWVALPVDI